MKPQEPPFYGKYRGIVKENKDPRKLGRIRAWVEDVLGDKHTGWALPSTPYAGEGVGLFLIPPINAWVWMEFENGDPDYPIWTGCFWGKEQEVPAKPAEPEIKMLKTEFCTITLDDSKQNKGITIVTEIDKNNEMKIVMDATGIKITASSKIDIIASSKAQKSAKVVLKSGTVSINGDALEVT